MGKIVELIDKVISDFENEENLEAVKAEVRELMKGRALFNA